MITFVCYPKCTTCQKAQKWLDAHQIAYALRDIKADNPTAEELAAWHRLSGLPLKKFFNTSGLLYRSLELKDKLPDMTEEEMLALLATDGMLVKRRIRPRGIQGKRMGREGLPRSLNEIIFMKAQKSQGCLPWLFVCAASEFIE